MKCLLDLDGVLTDFVKGMCKAHNRPNPYENPDNFGTFDMNKVWGISMEELWAPTRNVKYWAELEPMHDFHVIMEIVESFFGHENICLLSSPGNIADVSTTSAMKGKYIWILKHLPQYGTQYLLGPKKQWCASPDHVLVDDYDYNIEVFRQHGGRAVLVPRPWNKLYDRSHELDRVVTALETIRNDLED